MKNLSEFATTFEEDQIILLSTISNNLRNILILRSGQKKIYKYYIKICEEVIDILSQGYVKTIELLRVNQDKVWIKYLEKILSIMPHEKSKEMKEVLLQIS